MKKNMARFGFALFAAMLLTLVAAGPAAAATQTFRTQENFSIFVPCANGGAGELVEGIARVHVVIIENEDGAGGAHFHFSAQYRGAGLGTVTGDTYRFHADTPAIFIGNRVNATAGGAFNAAITYKVDVIGTGSAPTFTADAHAQITVNANGVTTMEKGDFTVTETCN